MNQKYVYKILEYFMDRKFQISKKFMNLIGIEAPLCNENLYHSDG